MKASAPMVAKAIGTLAKDTRVSLVFSTDVVDPAIPVAIAESRTPEQARTAIEDFRYAGGRDAVPALLAALDLAIGQQGTRILWLHGPQPMKLAPTDGLMQFADRCAGQSILHGLQVTAGPNVVARELVERKALTPIPRQGDWDEDLAGLLADWDAGGEQFVIERGTAFQGTMDHGSTPPASRHVARLWAAQEVERLAAQRGRAPRSEAVALAVEYQLVTSVTGAVVLETEAQYQRAGLEAVDAATVPILPEPELVFIVLLAALVALASFLARRKRSPRLSP